MATKETWDKLRYFKRDSKIDNWGDPNAISDTHLLRLDDFRHYISSPVFVLHGVKTTGHSKKSFHYSRRDSNNDQIGACATDIVVPGYKGDIVDLFIAATRFGFTGIGVYPYWAYGGKMVGGLHLDSRPLKWDQDDTLNYSHARWLGILNEEGDQEYLGLDLQNLVEHSGHLSIKNGR